MDFNHILPDFNYLSKSEIILYLVQVILGFGLLFAFMFKHIEFLWVRYVLPKPFFKHLYLKKRELSSNQLHILTNQFSFYSDLSPKEKKYFEHRVSRFIDLHDFEGRAGLYVSDHHRVLIASTAVMLTFGYREYTIKSLKRFIIYPDVFKSPINKAYHKGEYNPALKAVAFSWKDFLEGYEIANNNLNLGIHEIVHAIHHDFMRPKKNGVSALIFKHYYFKINNLMLENVAYRERLIASKYLRDYAFTNNFEFIAVVIESFFETPREFRGRYPELYNYVKRMLNFDFNEY